MASSDHTFHIESRLSSVAIHHSSFKDLWETKWSKPASLGIYPFMFGHGPDFEQIAASLTAKSFKPPYDWDAYASEFFPKAEELTSRANEALKEGNEDKAAELYLRAGAVYRISRFPIPRSELQIQAWKRNKEVALKGLNIKYGVTEVQIPHITHAVPKDGSVLPGWFLAPNRITKDVRVPLVVIVTGLDAYRTDLGIWIPILASAGLACLVVEIPGTGDNPVDRCDPSGPDRIWTSMFDWVRAREEIDETKVCIWGFSTGGHYALRLAHTHAKRVKGVVAQGGGGHYMFSQKWLEGADGREYPFDLCGSLTYKFGYGDDKATFMREAQAKYSLLENSILDMPCSRLLLINGTEDEIFPIDDYYLTMLHGWPKDVRLIEGQKHMGGEPASFAFALRWIFHVLEMEVSDENAERRGVSINALLGMLPFKAKYA